MSAQICKITTIDCLTISSFTFDTISSIVNQSEYFVSMFSVSDTLSFVDTSSRIRVNSHRRINSYSDRRIQRSKINTNISMTKLKAWTIEVELELNSLISTEENIYKVLCLLYHYHHLNDTDLINLFCIDLIVHRVWIASETKVTKLANNLIQKRWSTHFKWWLRKIIQEDIKERVYEFTETVNDRLSRWNAWAVIVNKVKNLTSQDESRVIFDYSRVTKKLSDIYMKLSFKMHDNLADSRHHCLFSANLKHAYLRISLHSNDKRYFAFMISDIDQLQSTRMQQSSQSAKFTLIELMY